MNTTPEPRIYFDNHATTRVDPRVVEAMLPFFSEKYGNAGSVHSFGDEASRAVESSRESIAAALGANAQEILFTSGATESNNLAIRGVAERKRRRGNHLVSVRTEHMSVLEPLRRLAQNGYEVTLLDVEPHCSDHAGWLDPQRVEDALRDDTVLVSVMLANNEIGVVQPLAEIAQICHRCGPLLHCDATQAIGKLPVDVGKLDVDLMSFTAHKIYGPKGIGALYTRRHGRTVRLEPQITGGSQQGNRRSGTLNTPGIVGFARALELCTEELPVEAERLSALRNRLWEGLSDRLGRLQLCGPPSRPGRPTAAVARQSEPGTGRRGWGDAAAGHRKSGRQLRSHLRVQRPGPQPCTAGTGDERRPGAEQPAFRPGPVQYR